jgi:hypothetical protein
VSVFFTMKYVKIRHEPRRKAGTSLRSAAQRTTEKKEKRKKRKELNDVLGFPLGWVWNLIRVVAEAPENKDEFPDASYPTPPGYSVNAGIEVSYPDDQPDRAPWVRHEQ